MRAFLNNLIVAVLVAAGRRPAGTGLWGLYAELKDKPRVDLTHAFDSGIPHWGNFPDMTRETRYTYGKHGFWTEMFCHVGQWGTHVDPPVHFHAGRAGADEIPVSQMLLPLVVVDVTEKAARDPDYAATRADVEEWESRHGPVPENAFVALRTGWSARWPDQDAMQNVGADNLAHYPGWSLEALQYLYETRRIAASGHETTDTDPGVVVSRDEYPAESYVLAHGFQIELLAHLDRVPEAGALVSVTWPKLARGSGFPARVYAILP